MVSALPVEIMALTLPAAARSPAGTLPQHASGCACTLSLPYPPLPGHPVHPTVVACSHTPNKGGYHGGGQRTHADAAHAEPGPVSQCHQGTAEN